MTTEPETPFELYTKNFASKFSTSISNLAPSNKNFSIDLIMSKQLETLFYNSDFKATFSTGRVKVSFFESIQIEKYDLEKVNGIILITSNQEQEINKFVDFLNEFVNFHSKIMIKFYFLVYPQQTSLTPLIIKSHSTSMLKSQLEENIKVQNFNFDFYPFDKDLFSLEYPYCLNEMLLTTETCGLNLSAEAIYKWQILYGTFSNIFVWGKFGEKVLEIFREIEQENKNMSYAVSSSYPNLIVVDRTVDFATSLLSQFSYLGLLDEIFSINKGAIHIPKSILDPNIIGNDMTYYHLMSQENILPKIQNEDYNTVLQIIKTSVESLGEQKQIVNLQKDINFALQQLENERTKQAIKFHLRLREKIQVYLFASINVEYNLLQDDILRNEKNAFERLRDLIQIKMPIERVYRLIFLSNICFGGFNENQHVSVSRDLIESFGPERASELYKFEQAGLFVNTKDTNANKCLIDASNYDKFKVLVTSNQQVSCLASENLDIYAYHKLFNENMPIMVRKIHEFLLGKDANSPIKEWVARKRDKDESGNHLHQQHTLSGENSVKIQGGIYSQIKENVGRSKGSPDLKNRNIGDEKSGSGINKVDLKREKERRDLMQKGDLLIFVVGGITFSEVCCLRKISEQIGRSIKICTTSVIKNDTFIKSAIN